VNCAKKSSMIRSSNTDCGGFAGYVPLAENPS
jgi:hypothetical protein